MVTPSRPTILLGLLFAVISLSTAISARRLANAREQFDAAQTALLQTSRECGEMAELRTQSQTVDVGQRPAQDVIAQVNAVLSEVGIPVRHLNSLTPEAEAMAASAVSGTGPPGRGGLMQQSVRLVLLDLSPGQVGSFLIQWRKAQKIWTPVRIELAHTRQGKDSRDANRYDATIQITALYLPGPAVAIAQAANSPPTSEERP